MVVWQGLGYGELGRGDAARLGEEMLLSSADVKRFVLVAVRFLHLWRGPG